MQVEFKTRTLQRCFEDHAEAERRWGRDVARRYIGRVEMLHAAKDFDTLRSFAALRVHELRGDRKGEQSITLTGRWRLIVVLADGGDTAIVQEVTNHYGQ